MRIARRYGGAAAAVAITAAALVALPGSASSAPDHHNRCAVYLGLTEKVLESHYDDQPPTGFSVGDGGSYVNQLITRNGTVVATVSGTSVAVYQDGPQLWTVMTNTDKFADGDVIAAGLNDVTALMAGEWLSLPAKGVSGKLAGMTGTRSFKKRIDTPDLYDSKLVLC
jgi:hypothetical protein